MNTKNLKAYAPKARSQFIEAVKKRAAHFGIYEDRIEEVRIEGGAAIVEGRAFTRKEGEQRKRLENKVAERGYEMFIREMAYTWFNRLAALRYMEIHDFFDHGFRVLSHPENPDSLPEILSHASDVAESLDLDKSHVIELQLAGDKEEELYRDLLLGQCHHLHKIMPFMFEAIDDATELLLPSNLTKTDSILKGLINDIPEEDWQEIEVIGWLYQFYISEHKDAVIGKVVKSEDIPAATQLFTPNWIVKYLVQNSVGRQWLATYPDSELKGKMEYYIEPAEQSDDVIEQLKAITPTSIDPEEIKVLDPACGSGHILVEVYEVLREIYLERGYRLREIPELILNKNIYGLDIDDRAAQLAGFALMMKAREDDRRIFQRVEDGEVSLNVFSLQSTEHLDISKLWKALDLEGNQQTGSTGGLFDEPEAFVQSTGIYKEYFELLQKLKSAFLQAKTLGSLLKIEHQCLKSLISFKELLEKKGQGTDPAASAASGELLPIVRQAQILAQQYESVVANPPYMGSKYQTAEVKKYLKDNFKGYEKDLFSAFIIRNLQLTKYRGDLGFMTPFVWMFISSYEELRAKLIDDEVISTLIQLEYSGFDAATVPICTFTLTKGHVDDYVGSYIRLSDFKGSSNQGPKTLEAINNRKCGWLFDSKPDDFKKIPGSPIAYWISSEVRSAFERGQLLRDISIPRQGLATMDNSLFTREWHEVSKNNLGLEGYEEGITWFPYNKGGDYRKWFGNAGIVVNWKDNGKAIKQLSIDRYGSASKRVVNESSYFKESITWSKISSGSPSFRYQPKGAIFDVAGMSIFPDTKDQLLLLLAILNSTLATEILKVLSPTLNFEAGQVGSVPVLAGNIQISELVEKAIEITKIDWDSYEYSWNFTQLDLLKDPELKRLKTSVKNRFEYWNNKSLELYEIEKNIDRNCLLAYEIKTAPIINCLKSVSLKRNIDEGSFKTSTILESLSYAIALMMGRYSLDREGLVYAQSGNNGFKVLETESAYKSFPADGDGIVPLASEEWLFDDDATTRFKEFVKTVWGEAHLSENLEFVADSLCLHALKPKKGEGAMETIRRYFSTQFFKDHCKTYKKRPIYWLFSSGKEKAFECLVYLHRYNEGTLSRMRTEYVTPLMGKYDAQHILLSEQQLQATGTEARSIEKELKAIDKKQAELRTFDEQLKHFAEKRISLDLDDGVKANYGLFGNLLADVKEIHGKAVK